MYVVTQTRPRVNHLQRTVTAKNRTLSGEGRVCCDKACAFFSVWLLILKLVTEIFHSLARAANLVPLSITNYRICLFSHALSPLQDSSMFISVTMDIGINLNRAVGRLYK